MIEQREIVEGYRVYMEFDSCCILVKSFARAFELKQLPFAG